MDSKIKSVVFIVDRSFAGASDAFLSPELAVWIIESAHNIVLAEQLRSSRGPNSADSVTTFKAGLADTIDEIFAEQILNIDLHFGSYRAPKHYTTLDVRGAKLTDNIRSILVEHGLLLYKPNFGGFTVSRGKSLSQWQQDFSPREIEDLFHDRVLDQLDLLASSDEQLKYQANVPLINVVVELFCMWDDLGMPGCLDQPHDSMTAEQILALRKFNQILNEESARQIRLGKKSLTIDELHAMPEWQAVIKAAGACRALFRES